jgi:3'(2'), 5'-bisphosphate nucleotidase
MQAYAHELAVASRAARAAGLAIARHYAAGVVDVQTKVDASPVTAADLEANQILVDAIGQAFPDDGLLSEETPDDGRRLGKRRVWIVDPLDGTRDFVARTGEFCVHVGLAEEGAAVLGVVYRPVTGELFFAAAGQGAFLDVAGAITPLRTSAAADLHGFRVGVSRFNFAEPLRRCLAAVPGVSTVVQGASVKQMALARGDLDAVINLSPGEQEWDTCAPEVILREAGCLLTDGDGRPFRYNQRELVHRRGSVASNGHQHAALLRLVRQVLP